jgi:hypothetical protein
MPLLIFSAFLFIFVELATCLKADPPTLQPDSQDANSTALTTTKAPSPSHARESGNKYIPKGFLNIPFGTSLESAESLLKEKDFQFRTFNQWQIKIYGHFSFSGGDATEAILSFNPDSGFYEGSAKLEGKDPTDTNSLYDRIHDLIQRKYRSFPKEKKRQFQKGKRYSFDEWLFSTPEGKYGIEIMLYNDVVHINYKASQFTPKFPATSVDPDSFL